jgi:hypothetical protein
MGHRRNASGLRRTLIAWAALLGVLAAPVAETVHQFTHLRAAESTAQGKKGGDGAACETCAAYAAMGHALSPWPWLEATPQASEPVPGFTPHARPAARRLSYRQRAPPLPLASA